jgi:hypothetical protein
MRRFLVGATFLALFATGFVCTKSQAQTELRVSANSPGSSVDVSYFYDSLSPSGQWIDDGTYGWCWTPYDMAAGWRPYSDGHWEYTDYGWSWASNESWGWATYHYGRWYFDDQYGWIWVPGSEWAPAWVAWRYGDDCVGWAPLPPSAGWSVSAGLDFRDADRIPSHEWCFVPRQHMLDGNVRMQVTSVARNPTMLSRSQDATRFEVRNGRPANVGFDVSRAEKLVGRHVPLVKIVDVGTPSRGGGRAVAGGVGFYRPTVKPAPAGRAPARAAYQAAPPAQFMQRQQATQQRRLENDLSNEHKRLARDQQNELRARAPGPAADQVRQQHAAEQQAFQAHATQQRQVLAQRIQRQVVRPAPPGRGRPAGGNGQPPSQGHGNERDKGGK